MVDSCTFCKEEVRESRADETGHFYLKYDLYPVTPGHMLIVSKEHIDSLWDLSTEEQEDYWNALDKAKEHIKEDDLEAVYQDAVEKSLDEASERYCREAFSSPFLHLDPHAYNIGENDGEAAGRTVEHLHIHVIPRYKGDMEDPRGGVRHVIPERGNYKE